MSWRMMRCIVLTFLISLLSTLAFAQEHNHNHNEINLLKEFKTAENSPKIRKRDQYKEVQTNTNELQMLFSGLFLFYKEFISSQDAQSCSFTPSCSVYALQAVKAQGVLKGMMNGFDRLSRCNSLSPEKYEVDPQTRLLIDPLKIQ